MRYSILNPEPQPMVDPPLQATDETTAGSLTDSIVGLGSDIVNVEPWSGAVVIGRPGLVRIMHFD